MEIRIETVVDPDEMLADGTAWLAVDYYPGHQGDVLSPPEPARYIAEVLSKEGNEVLWAGSSETSVADAIKHLAPPILPSVTTGSRIDWIFDAAGLDQTLINDGALVVDYYHGQDARMFEDGDYEPPEPGAFVATLTTAAGDVIASGASEDRAVEALRDLAPVPPVQRRDDEPNEAPF